MQSYLVLVGLLVSSTLANLVPDNSRALYEEFKQTYGKNYANEDDERRFAIFKENLLRINKYQTEEQGTAEYGITQFSDLTEEEFLAKFANSRMEVPNDSERLEDIEIQSNAISFDWRTKGAVNPVENQGHCGSCWAFSVVGNIEGQWFLKTRKLKVLSKQQLLDCDHVDHGCNGGYPPRTYTEVKRMGGLELQSDYQYHARNEKCKLNRQKLAAHIDGSVVLSQDERKQASWIAQNGPPASALNANTLQFYRGGIMRPFSCNPQKLNHAVLTVGFGEEMGKPYWIVKNSWGTGFGEHGYFRIHRGAGTCGINLVVSSAIIR